MSFSPCPGCLRTDLRTSPRNTLVRHGFSAHNIKHGENVGYHVGGCPGTNHQPIGTEEGNQFALALAARAKVKAAEIAALPAITIEDATENAIKTAVDFLQRSARFRGNRDATIADRFSKPADFANTSYRGWFSEDALAARQTRMINERINAVVRLVEYAEELRVTVAEHPPA